MQILLQSRDVYRNYTTPLGLGFMCRPGFHYSCDIDGYEYDKWGTYHFADRNGLGNDRTTAGTNFVSQYDNKNRDFFNDLATCPDEDLCFFHFVKYTHKLHSGKTVIQHIYDSHFDGFAKVQEFVQTWDSLRQELVEEDFANVKTRLHEQEKSAEDWRDKVNTYFFRKSGIVDEKGRLIHK
jgi:alpha-glucuronidase